MNIVIQLPLNGFNPTTLDNLARLIESKAGLIRKAFGVTELPVAVSEETVDFPWFDRELESGEITAYTHFLFLLCDMAKRQARVIATEKPVENEKYAFRCFLLRLGMIGGEYAETRRILLRNLSGNGSMKSGENKPPKKKEQLEPEPPQPEPETPPPKSRFSFKKLLGGLKIMAMD